MTAAERREKKRAWYAANKDKAAAHNHKYRYGITKEQFDDMLSAQNNACAICGTSEPRGRGAFHVDHCHETQNIRGLLCNLCNTGLGRFKDNPAALRKAALYLEGLT